MKIQEFFASLTNVKDDTVIQVADGPIFLAVDHTDAMAGALLLYLYEQASDDEPISDTEETLISNLLTRMQDACNKAAALSEDGSCSIRDMLTDDVRAILSAWWWLTYVTASRHYHVDFDAEGKTWTEVPNTPNPNIQVVPAGWLPNEGGE